MTSNAPPSASDREDHRGTGRRQERFERCSDDGADPASGVLDLVGAVGELDPGRRRPAAGRAPTARRSTIRSPTGPDSRSGRGGRTTPRRRRGPAGRRICRARSASRPASRCPARTVRPGRRTPPGRAATPRPINAIPTNSCSRPPTAVLQRPARSDIALGRSCIANRAGRLRRRRGRCAVGASRAGRRPFVEPLVEPVVDCSSTRPGRAGPASSAFERFLDGPHVLMTPPTVPTGCHTRP